MQPQQTRHGFYSRVGEEQAHGANRSCPKMEESRRKSSCVVNRKADLSIMQQLGRSVLPWVAEQGTTKQEGITAAATAGELSPLLGSVNQERCWKMRKDSVKKQELMIRYINHLL